MKLDKLTQLKKLTPMSKLSAEQVKELQKGLAHLEYPVGTVDGDAGPNTRTAWRDFLTDTFSGDEILIGNDFAELLQIRLDAFDKAEEERKKKDEETKKNNDLGFKLELLPKIKKAVLLSELKSREIEELQTALHRLGYAIGKVDGLLGRRTNTAWAEFKTDIVEGNPEIIGPISVKVLQEKLNKIGKGRIHDFSTVEGTIEAIKWEAQAQGIGLPAQIAYVLATVEWETAKTFKPVREAYWLKNAEEWRKKNLIYYPFYGRGYVQLTWRRNYQLYSDILEKDFVSNPDGVMDENISLFILVHGFKTGAFTGKKITDYINDRRTDFVEARRCINGTDRAHDIAHLALKHLTKIVDNG